MDSVLGIEQEMYSMTSHSKHLITTEVSAMGWYWWHWCSDVGVGECKVWARPLILSSPAALLGWNPSWRHAPKNRSCPSHSLSLCCAWENVCAWHYASPVRQEWVPTFHKDCDVVVIISSVCFFPIDRFIFITTYDFKKIVFLVLGCSCISFVCTVLRFLWIILCCIEALNNTNNTLNNTKKP